MDDERLSRGEALAGLGLLGGLAAALVGVIGYRILTPRAALPTPTPQAAAYAVQPPPGEASVQQATAIEPPIVESAPPRALPPALAETPPARNDLLPLGEESASPATPHDPPEAPRWIAPTAGGTPR